MTAVSTPEGVTKFTGILGLVFTMGAPAAIALSLLLMWIYRRSVLRQMETAAAAGGAIEWRARVANPAVGTRVDVGPSALNWSKRRWQAGRAFAGAGLAYALSATGLLLALSGNDFVPARTLMTALVEFAPFTLLLGLQFFTSRRACMWLAFGYITLLACFGLVSEHWYGPFQVLFGLVGAPLALVGGFLWWRIRAVGPLSLAFVLLLLLGANLALLGLGDNLRGVSDLGSALGMSSGGLMTVVVLLGAAPAGALGWWLLKAIGKRYQARRINDQTLVADAVLFTFALFFGVNLVFATLSPSTFVLGMIPFGCFKLVAWLLRLLSSRGEARPLHLVLLRVFSNGAEPAKLWDCLGRSWRYVGTDQLIGGPDLAITTLKPDAFLDFLSGRLKRRFIGDSAELNAAVGAFDEEPDVEGRFAVNELYCRADTWQHAFAIISERSDVVLMDLRGFTRERMGAAFELAQLAATGALSRTVLLTDASTNDALIAETLTVSGASPASLARILSFPGRSIRIEPLMAALTAAVATRAR